MTKELRNARQESIAGDGTQEPTSGANAAKPSLHTESLLVISLFFTESLRV